MGIFNEFFKKEKPVFTGITRGVGGFGFGKAAGGGEEAGFSLSGGSVNPSGLEPGNGYVYHTFTGPGTLTANAPGDVELFLIGGGGAGGNGYGGGGGAGALIYRTTVPVTAGSYPIVVGAGGIGSWVGDPGPNPTSPNADLIGGDSTALGFTADAGGAGNPSQGTGGSSGGVPGPPGAGPQSANPSTGQPGHPGAANVESPPVGWGNPGGGRADSVSGGGGGARGAGGDGHPTGANGGNSAPYPNFAGPLIGLPALNPLGGEYAGGGGAGASTQFGPNGTGSGGGGGATAGNIGGWEGGKSASATANTGSGSGGGGHAPGNTAGSGSGGSGICVIRYQK